MKSAIFQIRPFKIESVFWFRNFLELYARMQKHNTNKEKNHEHHSRPYIVFQAKILNLRQNHVCVYFSQIFSKLYAQAESKQTFNFKRPNSNLFGATCSRLSHRLAKLKKAPRNIENGLLNCLPKIHKLFAWSHKSPRSFPRTLLQYHSQCLAILGCHCPPWAKLILVASVFYI